MMVQLPDNERKEHDHIDCNTGVIRESCDRPNAGGSILELLLAQRLNMR